MRNLVAAARSLMLLLASAKATREDFRTCVVGTGVVVRVGRCVAAGALAPAGLDSGDGLLAVAPVFAGGIVREAGMYMYTKVRY